MKLRDPTLWMWGEALDVLERADRLHRQFFLLGTTRQASPTWEPPVDIFETDDRFVIVLALPGVMAEQLSIDVEPGAVVVRGQRRLPSLGHQCRIHRLELPYGRFERRIELPPRQLHVSERQLADGCLTLSLSKLETP
jgi:HSP20 family molecular chaperone IbpA